MKRTPQSVQDLTVAEIAETLGQLYRVTKPAKKLVVLCRTKRGARRLMKACRDSARNFHP